MRTSLFLMLILLSSNALLAQSKQEVSLKLPNKEMISLNVATTNATYQGKSGLKVIDKDGADSEFKFLKINDLDFKNGTIELDIAGKPGEKAFQGARGFVGIAFRINADNSKFECIYLRPTNGRADDQVRRNHSVQYTSIPDYPWAKLRREFPEKYESYVDLVPGEWTKMKIEIKGDKAKLYVHGNPQPTLIVNDLKLGADIPGKIGLWIGPGTEAYFANLVITRGDKAP
jgi:hypothetical protein